MNFDQHIRDASTALAAGEGQRAYSSLRWAFMHLTRPGAEDRLDDALRVFAGIARALGAADLLQTTEGVLARPDDAEALVALVNELIAEGLSEPTLAVLLRLRAHAPRDPDLLSAICSELEEQGRYPEARDLLEEVSDVVDHTFYLRYLRVFHTLMSGDLPAARAALDELGTPADSDEQHMRDTVERMLERADAVEGTTPLDDSDLRGWHYVITGSVLLTLSAFGWDAGMNGRWAYVTVSESDVHTALDRLGRLLQSWELTPRRILAPPDRDSQIVAQAAGRLFGLPVVPFEVGPGLVVCWDLATIDEDVRDQLERVAPDQLVYAQVGTWTKLGLAADVVGLLAQHAVTPWGEHMAAEPDGGGVRRVPPNDAPAAEVAASIAAAPLNEDDDLDDDGEIRVSRADRERLLAAARIAAPERVGGRRDLLWYMGPVTSSRFA